MAASSAFAPGWPGSPARWTSSAKSGVGTAIDVESRVWFSLSHGILNEIYFPRVDQACTRDLGLIVTDGASFFSEEKRDAASTIDTVEDGVPAYLIDSRCRTGRYRIEKTVLTDPRRDVLLQQVRFLPRGGAPGSPRLFALLAPHLGNHGSGNTAWVGDYKGVPMLFAEGHGTALALASSRPWRARSAGFVGTSDGWQELEADKELARCHARAENGNVALCGEIDLSAHDMDPTGDADGTFVLALGFGAGPEEAALRARASLEDGFESALIRYVGGWRRWQRRLVPLDRTPSPGRPNAYRVGTAVMRAHEDASFPGALIASLSVPWGFEKGDDDLGGFRRVVAGGAVGTRVAPRAPAADGQRPHHHRGAHRNDRQLPAGQGRGMGSAHHRPGQDRSRTGRHQ